MTRDGLKNMLENGWLLKNLFPVYYSEKNKGHFCKTVELVFDDSVVYIERLEEDQIPFQKAIPLDLIPNMIRFNVWTGNDLLQFADYDEQIARVLFDWLEGERPSMTVIVEGFDKEWNLIYKKKGRPKSKKLKPLDL